MDGRISERMNELINARLTVTCGMAHKRHCKHGGPQCHGHDDKWDNVSVRLPGVLHTNVGHSNFMRNLKKSYHLT